MVVFENTAGACVVETVICAEIETNSPQILLLGSIVVQQAKIRVP